VLFDVRSSDCEGRTCPLARFGHQRDGHTGLPTIVYGVMTDADGCPVATEVPRTEPERETPEELPLHSAATRRIRECKEVGVTVVEPIL
jgi:hypothetical protein